MISFNEEGKDSDISLSQDKKKKKKYLCASLLIWIIPKEKKR